MFPEITSFQDNKTALVDRRNSSLQKSLAIVGRIQKS
jgi:hypothetical protein